MSMFGLLDDWHRRRLLLTLLVGAGLLAYLTGSVPSVLGVDLAMLLAVVGGLPIFRSALLSLRQRTLSGDLAVALAIVAALAIGQYLVAAEVVFVMLVGRCLEHVAMERARTGITALLTLRPETARVRRDNVTMVVPAEEIRPDDVVILRPGDRIAVDGRVIEGSSSVDQSPITGEPVPADKTAGDEVFAGTINLHGAMEVAVVRLGDGTTLEQIIRLVEQAEAAKAPGEVLADRCAAWFVPVVLAAAGVAWLASGDAVRAVAVLLAASSGALVLAAPTAAAAAIGRLVRRGVLVQGSAVLETLGRVRAVMFDKTGTLTMARHTVERLRHLGIARMAIFTGDDAAAARAVGQRLGIEDVWAGLLPADKMEALRDLRRRHAPVAVVGDAIEDAPLLATADVGIAMADLGADAAMASAGVVLVGNELEKLADAVACSRRMVRVIRQNVLVFALVLNVLAVAAAALGWVGPVAAAVLNQVISLAVALNSLRLLVDLHAWRHRAERFSAALRRRRLLAASCGMTLAAMLYAASGLFVVGAGEVGVVQEFGRMTGPPLPPGLHYCLPFPFGRVRRVKPDEVRRVAIGSSSEPAPGTPRPQEAEILTGDTNLVDVQAVAHYRVTDPAAALFAVGATQADGQPKWDLLVRQSVEEALRAEILRRPADAALAADRSAIEAAVRNRAADTLRRYGCGLTLDAVRLGSVRPPPEVAHAFLEADCAAEDKQAKINRAETARLRVQAVFQAEALRRVAAAQAYGQARPELARGESARFLELAEAQAAAPEAARFRLRLETAEQTLAGRRKLILDRPSQGNPVP